MDASTIKQRAREELRKVVWPTWPEARGLTLIVLGVIVLGAIVLGSFDWLFSELIKALISLPI